MYRVTDKQYAVGWQSFDCHRSAAASQLGCACLKRSRFLDASAASKRRYTTRCQQERITLFLNALSVCHSP